LEHSFNGTTWTTLQSLSAGLNDKAAVFAPYLRVKAVNAHLINAESINIVVLTEWAAEQNLPQEFPISGYTTRYAANYYGGSLLLPQLVPAAASVFINIIGYSGTVPITVVPAASYAFEPAIREYAGNVPIVMGVAGTYSLDNI
jgi:hypothetical protein